MFNGRRRFKKRTGNGTTRRVNRYRGTTRVPMARKKFAPRGTISRRLNRKEIKYDDDFYSLKSWTPFMHADAGGTTNWVNYVLGGVIGKAGSSGFVSTTTSTGYVPAITYAPNCLTNVSSGTTAKTRIGNLVQPRFITVKGVLEAAKCNLPTDAETTINQEGVDPNATAQTRYIRTSIKVFIIRDKNMNEKGFVRYEDVFEPANQGLSTEATKNPFLWNRRVDVIGRYDIIKTMTIELDQDDPQRSFTEVIGLRGKAIRYNGSAAPTAQLQAFQPVYTAENVTTTQPGWVTNVTLNSSVEVQSMTNGIYLLAVSHSCTSALLSEANFMSPGIVFSSRLTFED